MIYKFRYFFDPGSGVCLWSGDDGTRERFDYPVESRKLPLSGNLQRRLDYVVAWYDTAINWDYPPDPSPWSDEEWTRFRGETDALLGALRQALGPDFEIVDERKF
jgi:hypothetical protein